MPRDASDQPTLSTDALLDLLEQCVAALEAGHDRDLETLLNEHAEHADALREQLARLERLGLLRTSASGPIDDLVSFGQYTVHRRLGAGGMGSVWLAEQSAPARRLLALKVVKAGMDSEEVLARFDIERRTLALMNHPHIAQLYDAGVTPQGRPYFAMEYVEGEPITDYADRHQLDTEQRLRLLLPVLEAVQHAHQKGVIHRDLKPSNILVAERDGVPTPKVIDFGVARALDVTEFAATRFTALGQLVGTPEYMSPEQADGHTDDIDTRSDVYALGVVLFELLTGSMPLDREFLRRAGYREMLRQIHVQDPPTPSARITTLGDRTSTVASARCTTPAALRRRLRGDLDWITLKALEKERGRRYSTVKEFGDDLSRHLASEPVRAGSPSSWYRMQRWANRHRTGVVAGVITAAALVVGLVASVWFGVDAAFARDRAVRNFESAMAAVDEVLTRVGHADLEHVPHMEQVRRNILRRAVAFYEGFLEQESDDPDVLLGMAQVGARLAEVHADLSEFAAARARYAEAIADFEQVIAWRPEAREARVGAATGQCRLAAIWMETDREQARFLFAQGLARLRALRRPGADGQVARRLADGLYDAAALECHFDQARAIALYGEAIAVLERLAEAHPDDDEMAWALARARCDHGLRQCEGGDLDRAAPELKRVDLEARRLLDSGTLRADMRFACSRMLGNLGAVSMGAGEPEQAVQRFTAAERALQLLTADFPAVDEYRYALASMRNNLGSVSEQLGQLGDASDSYERAARDLETLFDKQPEVWKYQLNLITTLANLGAIIDKTELSGEIHLRRAAELSTGLLQRNGDDPHVQNACAWAFDRLALHLERQGQGDEAMGYWQRAVPLSRAATDALPGIPAFHVSHIDVLIALGAAARRHGDAAMAARHLEASLAASTRALEHHPESSTLLQQAARVRITCAQDLVATEHAAAAQLLDADALVAAKSPSALLGALTTLCRCVERARSDPALSVDEQRGAVDGYVRQAVALLQRAAVAGYDATPIVRREPSLAPLAARPEFEQWAREQAFGR